MSLSGSDHLLNAANVTVAVPELLCCIARLKMLEASVWRYVPVKNQLMGWKQNSIACHKLNGYRSFFFGFFFLLVKSIVKKKNETFIRSENHQVIQGLYWNNYFPPQATFRTPSCLPTPSWTEQTQSKLHTFIHACALQHSFISWASLKPHDLVQMCTHQITCYINIAHLCPDYERTKDLRIDFWNRTRPTTVLSDGAV